VTAPDLDGWAYGEATNALIPVSTWSKSMFFEKLATGCFRQWEYLLCYDPIAW